MESLGSKVVRGNENLILTLRSPSLRQSLSLSLKSVLFSEYQPRSQTGKKSVCCCFYCSCCYVVLAAVVAKSRYLGKKTGNINVSISSVFHPDLYQSPLPTPLETCPKLDLILPYSWKFRFAFHSLYDATTYVIQMQYLIQKLEMIRFEPEARPYNHRYAGINKLYRAVNS